MDDKEKERRFRRTRREQMRRSVLIQTDTIGEIRRLLQISQASIQATLAGAPSDFEGWRVSILQAEIRRAMEVFERGAANALMTGIDRSWTAGSDLVVAPLTAAGLDIGARLPALDPRLLLALKSFQTDRIKDISTTVVNRINQDLSQVVIGVETPYEAIRKVADHMQAPAGRAGIIVRTDLGTAYSEATQQRMEQARKLGVEGLQKQWRRSGKLHPRLTHDLADGQIVDVDKPYIVGGIEIPKPRDPSIPASERISCGCTSLPYMRHWRVSIPGPKPYTAQELEHSQAARQVEEVRATQAPPAPQPPPEPAPEPFHRRMVRDLTPLAEADIRHMPTDVAEWHRGAWPHVDDVLRRAISGHATPPLLPPQARGAYAMRGGAGIMMSEQEAAKDKASRSVAWRHEYGHHLDTGPGARDQTAGAVSYRAVPEMGATARHWEAVQPWPDGEDLISTRPVIPAGELSRYWERHGIAGLTLDDIQALTPEPQVPILIDALRTGDPEGLLLAWVPRDKAAVELKIMVSDFVEAVSQCKLGGEDLGTGGHGRPYYAASGALADGYRERHALEAFANWVAIRSDRLQQVKVIVAHLARDAVEGMERVLREIADAGRI